MCICGNCKWLDRYKTYYDLEKNYEVEHLTSYPEVNAKNQILHISLVEEKMEIFN